MNEKYFNVNPNDGHEGENNDICTHLHLEIRNAELFDYRCPDAHCPPGKDIRADFSGLSRLRGLLQSKFLSENKKISSPCGRDLDCSYPTEAEK